MDPPCKSQQLIRLLPVGWAWFSVVSELGIVETDFERRPLFNFASVNCAVKLVDHLRLKRALSVLDVVNRSFDNFSVYIYWVERFSLDCRK